MQKKNRLSVLDALEENNIIPMMTANLRKKDRCIREGEIPIKVTCVARILGSSYVASLVYPSLHKHNCLFFYFCNFFSEYTHMYTYIRSHSQ